MKLLKEKKCSVKHISYDAICSVKGTVLKFVDSA